LRKCTGSTRGVNCIAFPAMISVSSVAKEYGDRTLFADATFQLNAGERHALVGANGSGKTTLLNILSGTEEATAGSVSIPKNLRIGVLRQDQFVHEAEEVLGVALMGNPALWRAMVEKEALLARAGEEFDAERFSELEEIVQHHDGYAAESRAATILEGLGLPADVHRRPLSTLSGGFKLRVLLAQVLASAPDALLLDEPTNHLDILSIRWLEKFLREFAGPVVVISHDHRFIDTVATHVLDVDYETVTLYHGNYTEFLEAKQSERERREKEIAGREREIAHHQKFVDRFKAKASKARQAQSKARMIERKAEGLAELPSSSRRYPAFRFEQQRPSGKEVLKVKGVRKAFGANEVLHGVNLEVRRGDRLAIMGANGIGKSTLLKIIMGELGADGGAVEWGYEAHPGYFAQDHQEQFEAPNQTAESWVWDWAPEKDIGYIRGAMGLVLFSGDDGKKKLASLSGGEAARLVFCRMTLRKPNVLVLDEPTNHLDLESIEALVKALGAYPGTLIFVSHDRWFVGELATRIVEIRKDGIQDFEGTYEEYVHYCGDDHLDVDTVVLKAQSEKRKAKTETVEPSAVRRDERPRISDHAKRRLAEKRDAITARIEEAEVELAAIDSRFADPAFYSTTARGEIHRLQEERERLQARLEGLMSDWEAVEAELVGSAALIRSPSSE
jgi:ATPase subunit of ABC transporter with duplicated ATPase domains